MACNTAALLCISLFSLACVGDACDPTAVATCSTDYAAAASGGSMSGTKVCDVISKMLTCVDSTAAGCPASVKTMFTSTIDSAKKPVCVAGGTCSNHILCGGTANTPTEDKSPATPTTGVTTPGGDSCDTTAVTKCSTDYTAAASGGSMSGTKVCDVISTMLTCVDTAGAACPASVMTTFTSTIDSAKKPVCAAGGACSNNILCTCSWSAHAGKFSSGHAGGVSTMFPSAAAAKNKCIELGQATCKAITCSTGGSCSVRASSTLKSSPAGETTYVPSSDCFDAPTEAATPTTGVTTPGGDSCDTTAVTKCSTDYTAAVSGGSMSGTKVCDVISTMLTCVDTAGAACPASVMTMFTSTIDSAKKPACAAGGACSNHILCAEAKNDEGKGATSVPAGTTLPPVVTTTGNVEVKMSSEHAESLKAKPAEAKKAFAQAIAKTINVDVSKVTIKAIYIDGVAIATRRLANEATVKVDWEVKSTKTVLATAMDPTALKTNVVAEAEKEGLTIAVTADPVAAVTSTSGGIDTTTVNQTPVNAASALVANSWIVASLLAVWAVAW